MKSFLYFVGISIGTLFFTSIVSADSQLWLNSTAYSSDGKQNAFVLTRDTGTKTVVWNGKEIGFPNVESNSLWFDKNNLVFSINDNGKYSLVLNGVPESPKCDYVLGVNSLLDGTNISYTCTVGSMTRIYFIGGKSYGPFSSAYPVYSTQSETYAYTVIEDSGKSYFILADGSYLGKEYQYANNLFLSGKNGTRKTFQFQKWDKQYLMLNGRIGRAYDEITSLTYNSDLNAFQYIARLWNQYFLMQNNRVIKWPVLEIGVFWYSYVKKTSVMSYRTETGWMLNVGGVEYGPFLNSPNPGFSEDDGMWSAFVNKGGKQGILFNGKFIER